tara:strand:+ start:719 stop:1000 length:282 start_codon:yes stop_codon:yes gene_type:complete
MALNVEGFTIEKGVEVTPHKAGGLKGRWVKICEAMEAGDSVLVANESERGALATRINSRPGHKAVTRKQGDKIRVWKCVLEEGEDKALTFIRG